MCVDSTCSALASIYAVYVVVPRVHGHSSHAPHILNHANPYHSWPRRHLCCGITESRSQHAGAMLATCFIDLFIIAFLAFCTSQTLKCARTHILSFFPHSFMFVCDFATDAHDLLSAHCITRTSWYVQWSLFPAARMWGWVSGIDRLFFNINFICCAPGQWMWLKHF